MNGIGIMRNFNYLLCGISSRCLNLLSISIKFDNLSPTTILRPCIDMINLEKIHIENSNNVYLFNDEDEILIKQILNQLSQRLINLKSFTFYGLSFENTDIIEFIVNTYKLISFNSHIYSGRYSFTFDEDLILKIRNSDEPLQTLNDEFQLQYVHIN